MDYLYFTSSFWLLCLVWYFLMERKITPRVLLIITFVALSWPALALAAFISTFVRKEIL